MAWKNSFEMIFSGFITKNAGFPPFPRLFLRASKWAIRDPGDHQVIAEHLDCGYIFSCAEMIRLGGDYAGAMLDADAKELVKLHQEVGQMGPKTPESLIFDFPTPPSWWFLGILGGGWKLPRQNDEKLKSWW